MLEKNWREVRTRKIQKMEIIKLKLQYPQIKSHGEVVALIYLYAGWQSVHYSIEVSNCDRDLESKVYYLSL